MIWSDDGCPPTPSKIPKKRRKFLTGRCKCDRDSKTFEIIFAEDLRKPVHFDCGWPMSFREKRLIPTKRKRDGK